MSLSRDYQLFNVLQKVELRKADVAWKIAAEVAKEQTEEEQETQVIRHRGTCLSLCAVNLLLCCAILSSVNDFVSPYL